MARMSNAPRFSTGAKAKPPAPILRTIPTIKAVAEVEPASDPPEGVARMPKKEIQSDIKAAARDSELPSGWIEPTKPTRLSSSGRYRRPLEEPPMEGYAWNNIHGVWVPSGKYLEEVKRMKMPKPKKRLAPPEDTPVSTPILAPSVAALEVPALQRNPSVSTEESVIPKQPPSSRSSKKKKVEKTDPPEPLGAPTSDSNTADASIQQPPSPPIPEVEVNTDIPVAAPAAASDPPPVSQDVDTPPTLPSGKKKSIADLKETEEDNDEGDGFHPNSMWQEPFTNDHNLTLYEQHRAPRPAPTGTFICSMDALRQEFRCAICLDILRHTRIVRECLHRFCESCMEQALTFQNVEAIGGRRKECPICRVYIPSRRSMAPDPYMDMFIARLLDNLVWEEENDPQVYLTSPTKKRGHPLSTATTSQEDQIPEGLSTEDPPPEMEDKTSTLPKLPSTKPEENASWKHTTPGLIQIHLICGDASSSWDELQMPYITVAADAPTRIIQNFLRRKLGCANETTLTVWTIHKTRPYVASDHDSLHYLLRNRTDAFPGRYMPLYYSSRDKAPPIVKRGRPLGHAKK